MFKHIIFSLSLAFCVILLSTYYFVTFDSYRKSLNKTILLDMKSDSPKYGYNKISESVILKFNTYLEEYNRSYTGVEYNKRLRNFMNSLEEISELNRKSNGTAVYGLTKFSDMSKEEFSQKMLSRPMYFSCQQRHKDCLIDKNILLPTNYNFTDNLPAKVDWRAKGVVGEVLDQKLCPVCWAFSIVGVIESMNAMITKHYTRFSIQKLMDCAPGAPPGCVTRTVDVVVNEMCTTETIVPTEVDYPLTLKDFAKCKNKMKGRRIKRFLHDCDVDELYLLQLISLHPVVAVVNAQTWINYNSGVIKFHCDGATESLNHAIQIVGYDRTGSVPYYLVKNSWGKDFGEDGYVKIGMYNNVCGITRAVTTVEV